MMQRGCLSKNIFLNLVYLRKQYHCILDQNGLITESERINKPKLAAFLTEIASKFEVKVGEDFLARIIKLLGCQKAEYHPLNHLLLIRLLEHSAKSFFDLYSEEKLFEEGPWLCLNHAAAHFKQSCVTEYCVDRSESKGRIRGTFYCSCGFVYSQVNLEVSSKGFAHFDRVETFGFVWEAVLKELWNNPSLKIPEIAARLGVTHNTVVSQAERLRLRIPRSRNSTV